MAAQARSSTPSSRAGLKAGPYEDVRRGRPLGRPDVAYILAWLKARGTARNREGMARYGISSPKIFGVSMATMKPLVKRIGRDHALAIALWDSGWLEARLLASFIDDPAVVTASQMEQWARDFDNWAVCDSVCLHLFSYAGPRWRKAAVWPRRKAEFVRRAGCALLASLAVHDKGAADDQFAACLPTLEAIGTDERPMVKKAVSWALRQNGEAQSRSPRQVHRGRSAAGGPRPAACTLGRS